MSLLDLGFANTAPPNQVFIQKTTTYESSFISYMLQEPNEWNVHISVLYLIYLIIFIFPKSLLYNSYSEHIYLHLPWITPRLQSISQISQYNLFF